MWLVGRLNKCNEDCKLFRWNKCRTKDPKGFCDQPERYDDALDEWGDKYRERMSYR